MENLKTVIKLNEDKTAVAKYYVSEDHEGNKILVDIKEHQDRETNKRIISYCESYLNEFNYLFDNNNDAVDAIINSFSCDNYYDMFSIFNEKVNLFFNNAICGDDDKYFDIIYDRLVCIVERSVRSLRNEKAE